MVSATVVEIVQADIISVTDSEILSVSVFSEMPQKHALTRIADRALEGRRAAEGGNRAVYRFKIKINIYINYKIFIVVKNVLRIKNQL